MIYPWLAPCGSSPDYLHVCYFTETTQGNVRIRLCVTIIFKYFCVCGKGQILKISLQLGLLSTLKKNAFAFISPLSNFTRHTSFFS